MTNRTVLWLFGLMAPWLTWLWAKLGRRLDADVARTECANKCRVMGLVQSPGAYVSSGGEQQPSLAGMLADCYALGPFRALWAVEGLGKDLAEARLAADAHVTGLLTDAALGAEWDKAQLMLHAGIGLGFAKHHIEKLAPGATSREISEAVMRVVNLCRANSKPGYTGAALESLGLVSRFLREAAFCREVDVALEREAPDCRPYFWRGVGRCLYFHPTNFLLPRGKFCCRAIGRTRSEAPSEDARRAMLSGVGWTMTVVNMDTPAVMEWVLANSGDYECDDPGFFNGVVSSLVMRFDTTPDDPLIAAFREHRPAGLRTRALWVERVSRAVDQAVFQVHPVLKEQQRLEEVFRYQDLTELVASIEREAEQQRRRL